MPVLTEAISPADLLNADVPGFPGITGTFMGRDALTLGLVHLGLRNGEGVLAPAYTCQEVLGALQRNYKVLLYDIQPDLSIDPGEILSRLKSRRIKAVLITDYFGFLQPLRHEIKAMCARHGAWLIEDCAHSLLTDGSGDAGDAAIYSFRKIFPLRDGGGLKVKPATGGLGAAFYPRIYSDTLSFLAGARSALHISGRLVNRARVTSRAGTRWPAADRGNGKKYTLPLSRFARRKLVNISPAAVIAQRRSDFKFWSGFCERSGSVVPLFSELPPGVCPFGFPVSVENRGALEYRARRAGIPLQVHWRLDPERATDCRVSHQLSRNTLTLPLYPAITSKARQRLAQVLTDGG